MRPSCSCRLYTIKERPVCAAVYAFTFSASVRVYKTDKRIGIAEHNCADHSFFLFFLSFRICRTYVKRSVYDYFSTVVALTLKIDRSRKTGKRGIFRHPNSTMVRETNYSDTLPNSRRLSFTKLDNQKITKKKSNCFKSI